MRIFSRWKTPIGRRSPWSWSLSQTVQPLWTYGCIDTDPYRWSLANELGLVVVALYQKSLKLNYVEGLVDSIKRVRHAMGLSHFHYLYDRRRYISAELTTLSTNCSTHSSVEEDC